MVALEKLLKAAVLVAAGAIVLKASELGLKQLGEGNALIPRLVGAITQVIVIVFLADLVWHLLNAWINRSLLRRLSLNTPDAARREAKMRTLLPIIRNGLMVFITAVAAMMGLSAFGIEIGPLLAGAGIVGVAVGFGAQTIVKDIISGMFFLLDDAFRIGEYVQSGSYKGVVEGFSLRSVRLRHHRGALYTVPFSELGAIENLSRDWVIEKVTVGVTYDTDLAKVKKVVKEIGNELMSDPELSSYILETLKLQGVEKFGDFSVDLRMKIKTAPGDGQFMVKRRALALIKSKFARDGIQMPFPTVQVAGEKASDAATVAAVHNAVAGTSTAP
jgi:small-conductance mechanosensitive channel